MHAAAFYNVITHFNLILIQSKCNAYHCKLQNSENPESQESHGSLSVSLKYVPSERTGTVLIINVALPCVLLLCTLQLRNITHANRALFALAHVICCQVDRRTARGKFMSGCGRPKNYVAWSLRESILLLSGEGAAVMCYKTDLTKQPELLFLSQLSLSLSCTPFHCHVWRITCIFCFICMFFICQSDMRRMEISSYFFWPPGY